MTSIPIKLELRRKPSEGSLSLLHEASAHSKIKFVLSHMRLPDPGTKDKIRSIIKKYVLKATPYIQNPDETDILVFGPSFSPRPNEFGEYPIETPIKIRDLTNRIGPYCKVDALEQLIHELSEEFKRKNMLANLELGEATYNRFNFREIMFVDYEGRIFQTSRHVIGSNGTTLLNVLGEKNTSYKAKVRGFIFENWLLRILQASNKKIQGFVRDAGFYQKRINAAESYYSTNEPFMNSLSGHRITAEEIQDVADTLSAGEKCIKADLVSNNILFDYNNLLIDLAGSNPALLRLKRFSISSRESLSDEEKEKKYRYLIENQDEITKEGLDELLYLMENQGYPAEMTAATILNNLLISDVDHFPHLTYIDEGVIDFLSCSSIGLSYDELRNIYLLHNEIRKAYNLGNNIKLADASSALREHLSREYLGQQSETHHKTDIFFELEESSFRKKIWSRNYLSVPHEFDHASNESIKRAGHRLDLAMDALYPIKSSMPTIYEATNRIYASIKSL